MTTQKELTGMTGEALRAKLEALYTESQPLNDKLVDITADVIRVNTEMYRRAISKLLPGIAIDKTNVCLTLKSGVRPAEGIPQLRQRLEAIHAEGHRVSHVEYEATLNEFRFYIAQGVVEPPGVVSEIEKN